MPAATVPKTFRRLFVANRGEVAVRIATACDDLGITPVFAVSEADANAPYTEHRETICVGPSRAATSYLDLVAVVQAARQTGCSAVHPGWGFLSENPTFAALCQAHGLTFIGPPAHVMQLMGKKTPAKRAMISAGLTVIDGSDGVVDSVDEARTIAERIGYPILIKAESGGGGRGMRIARTGGELADAFCEAQAEAAAAFSDPRVYIERLIEGGRHIEIQILADRYGHAVHLGERDCSIQRNHQKLIEESPSVVIDATTLEASASAAARAAQAIGYVGAGTMEFLFDNGVLRFMEMNTRLQVEHCVTEMRSGIDLVHEQIRIAAGHPLSFTQSDIQLTGHAIECRINAEDPYNQFRPAPGKIERWEPPVGTHIRVDTHVQTGYDVSPHYDSLLCKVITWGEDRPEATKRMLDALDHLVCDGLPTTVPMHQTVLAHPKFRDSTYDTRAIPGWPPPNTPFAREGEA